jgi:hypothetical protein
MIEDTDNGTIVAVGAHVEGQLYKAKAYAEGDKPYFVLTPPLAYNGKKAWSDEKYFYNAKGEIARAYQLHLHDIFTVSEEAFVATPVVGQFVDATYALTDSAPAGFAGEVIAVVNYTNSKSYRIAVRSLGM